MKPTGKLSPKLTAKLYSFSFFDNFILIYPLYAIMFADAGLKPFQITSLFIVWSLTGFIVELPAGSIADKFGRKNTILVGVLAKFIGFGFWLFMRSYWGFLLGFVFWGIKSAFTSGAREALVYDELKQSGVLRSYAKVMGRMDSFSLLGIVLAALGASILAHHGYSPILVLSMASVVISGLALYIVPQSSVAKPIADTKYLEYLREGLKEIAHSRIILYFVMLTGVITGMGVVEEYFGLVFKERGFTNASIAFWIAAIYGIGSLGSLLAHRVENKNIKPELVVCGSGVLLFIAALVPGVLVPITLGLYFMLSLGAHVLFNAYMQKQISDKTRATTTSVGGFSSEIFALLGFFMITVGANRAGYIYGFKLIAVSIIVLSALLAVYVYVYKLSADSPARAN